jgi:hypothetical protein
VRVREPPRVSPPRLLTWLTAASPDATLFRIGERRERARSLLTGLEALKRTFAAQGMETPDETHQAEYAEKLAEDRLTDFTLRAEAERRGLAASEDEVARFTSQMDAQVRGAGGILPSPDELRDRARETLLVNKLLDAEAKPSEADLEAWLAAHRSQLTFADAAEIDEVLVPHEAGHARADELYVELKPLDEAAFLKRATEISANPAMAAVGWVDLGSVPPPLAARIRTAGPGSVAPPVESPLGFHIIRVNRKGHDVAPPLAEVRVRVAHGWRADHEEELRQRLLREALADLDVEWEAPANLLRRGAAVPVGKDAN